MSLSFFFLFSLPLYINPQYTHQFSHNSNHTLDLALPFNTHILIINASLNHLSFFIFSFSITNVHPIPSLSPIYINFSPLPSPCTPPLFSISNLLLTLQILSDHLQTGFPHTCIKYTAFCFFTFFIDHLCQPCTHPLFLQLSPQCKPYPSPPLKI